MGLDGLLGEQARHPSTRKDRRKGQAQRRPRTRRLKNAPVQQRRYDAARLTVAAAQHLWNIPTRQLSAIEDGLEDLSGVRRKGARPHFLIRP